MIISISGEKGAGKDTLALILAKNLHIRMYALAAPVKAAVAKLFKPCDKFEAIDVYTNDPLQKNVEKYSVEVDMEEVAQYLTDTHGVSIDVDSLTESFISAFTGMVLAKYEYKLKLRLTLRDMLQRFGTDFCQSVLGVECWCKLIPKVDNLIITDVRFPHERDYIQEHAPSTRQRLRTYFLYVDDPFKVPNTDRHPSEQDMRDHKYNAYVYNTKESICELESQVSDIIEALKHYVAV